eukprot:SAG22_NODE_404_length_11005_cov_8.751788_5_plen_103_part_00
MDGRTGSPSGQLHPDEPGTPGLPKYASGGGCHGSLLSSQKHLIPIAWYDSWSSDQAKSFMTGLVGSTSRQLLPPKPALQTRGAYDNQTRQCDAQHTTQARLG